MNNPVYKVVGNFVEKQWESCGEKCGYLFGCSVFMFGLWEMFGFTQSFTHFFQLVSTGIFSKITGVGGELFTLST